MTIVKLETGEELEFDNNYSDAQISQAVEEYLASKKQQTPAFSQSQLIQPKLGEGFFEENIARPALRAGKSIAAAGAGLADIANMAAEIPLYAGNRAFEYGRQAVTGQEVQPYQPVFMKNNVSEAVRQSFDRATNGLTANRNKDEELLEIPQEIVGGFISPTAAAKASQGAYQGAKELTKSGIRKLAAVKPELVQAFDEAGVTPRLADVTNSKPAKAFQNLLEIYPGSASKIKKATEQQIIDIENRLAGLTKSRGGTIQETGKKIQQGAVDFKGFVKNRVNNLYDDLDKHVLAESQRQISSYEKYMSPEQMRSLLMAGQQKIPVKNLLNTINDSQIQDVAAVGSGDTSRVLSRIGNIIDNEGNISYPRLKTFRSVIGAKLQSPSLMGDERAALKKIYGGLSEDMKAAVSATGGEKGLQAFNKANNAFARSQDLLEKNINPLIEAKTPEAVYNLALSGSKQGGSNIKPIMAALNPTQKDFVRGTIVKRMGLQNAGLQDETGEAFSPNKFLTEWNKLSPEARKNIFTPDQIKSVDLLNKAISNIKETSKIVNKSNNAPWFSWLGLAGLIFASPLQAASSVAGAKISAEMFTNPDFIRWLAQAPKVSQKEIPKYISQLSKIAATNSAISQDILEYIDSITQQ